MVGIVSWGSYVPRYRIRAKDIAQAWGQIPEQIETGLMISEKSVPGIDEDTITMSVEAARNALKASGLQPKSVQAIYIGSESHPYAVKPTGTVVGEALMIPNEYTTADFEFACKAGTAAIQVAMGLVKSGMAEHAIAGGADTAQAAPGDFLEYATGAGGAVFILGMKNVAAKINHTVSFTSDTPDFWRRKHMRYPAHGGAFTGEPAYFRHITSAAKLLMKKAGSKPEDYQYAIFHQPNGKFPRRAAKMLGFSLEQIKTGLLVANIGNTYSGATMLGLAAVLDEAKPGDRIMLTSYGSGAGSDSFDIEVTDEIVNVQKKTRKVRDFIASKEYVGYSEYLKNTGTL